jgi:hypothetical protein
MPEVLNSTMEPSASNRYEYYDHLHFIPIEKKDKYWAAQVIFFNKSNSRRLVEPDIAEKFRNREKGIIDKQRLVEIIDPKMPDDSGGKAEYFSADWKGNPIYLHLRRIQKAKLDQLPLSHVVRAADEYFQSNRHKENARIMGRKMFMSFINDINKELGLPQLRPDEDPFKYASKLDNTVATKTGGGPISRSQDAAINMVDSIKAGIEDNEDLALYNEYVHKDGVEIAIELATEHYLGINKFNIIREDIFSDLMNFTTYCFRNYTSKTTGEPVVEYLDCANVLTSKFQRRDGRDMTHWWTEYDVTFGDFLRMFGAKLNKEELKRVFERNRWAGGAGLGHGLEFDKCSRLQRDGARIRIGYMEWETQDMEVYGSGYVKNNLRYDQKPSDWVPPVKTKYQEAMRDERNYNCWYKCYYIPALASTSGPEVATSDFDLQAEFIFDFGKLQDQVREGEHQRLSRPSLIVWKVDEPSYAEVEDRFMGKIDLLWQQFQNDLANAMPHGQFFNEELITQALELLDEGNAEGKDNTVEVMRRMKQTGYGFGKIFDEFGKPLPPFVEIKTGHLASAGEKLNMIFQLYQFMNQCLGGNEISSGQSPKPRQALGGIEFAIEASNNATYYLQKGYIEGYTELGYRMLYYFREVVSEKDSKRLQEFRDIVSRANSAALEAIDGIPTRTLGLSVDMANTTEQNAFINQMALEMATSPTGLLDPDEALELTFINNVKYKFAILRMKMKKKRKRMMEEKARDQQFQMDLAQRQLDIQNAKIQAEGQVKERLMNVEKNWDAQLLQLESQLKFTDQSRLKTQMKDNRIEQDYAINEMKNNTEQQRPLL